MIGSLNQSQIDHLLYSELIGRLGCTWENQVYIVPLSYVFDGSFIYAHTREGMKVDLMRKNPEVCFEVDRIKDMNNWRSAIVRGTYEELNKRQADDAVQLLVNRLHPFVGSEASIPLHGLDRPHSPIDPKIKTVVFRIKTREKTGRYEKP